MSLTNNYHIAVPTAFHENENLNVDATLEHIRFLKKLGVNSVLLCASTGEQHSLNLSEKIELIESLESLDVSSDFEILFGISSIRQIEAEQLASKISRVPQISSVLIGYPPYILPTQKEALNYTTSIIGRVNKQAVIYNNPLRTGFDLSIQSYKDLINNHYISGIKEAGNPQKISELNEVIDSPLIYFAGGEKDLEKKICLGYNGLSSITGNLYPLEVKQWFDSLLKKEDTQDYNLLKNKIDKLFEDSPLPIIKSEISKIENINFGICRTPLGN